jgi:ArsR family transcriptional regulator
MYTAGMAKTQAGFSLDVLFRALADTTRLRLLNLIADREICVCYFVEILKTSQP